MAIGTLVFVPGLAGSELVYDAGLFGRVTIWLSPPAILAGGFRALRLPPPGGPAPAFGTPTITPGLPLPHFYGLLLAYMGQRGWHVVAPRSDWRRTQGHDLVALLDLLREELDKGPVWILAHSRGGLLTRSALAVLAAENLLGNVRRVVGLGVPHTGSLAATQNLACYAPLKVSIIGLGTFLPTLYSHFLGTTEVASVMASWQSLYELQPDPVRSWVAPGIAAALYTPATWTAAGLTLSAAYLAAAATRWATIPAPPLSVEWIDVAGTGFQTPFTLGDVASLAEAGTMGTTLQGDGVVPLVSARQSGRKSITTPTAHDWLPNDGRLYHRIHDALIGGLPADVTLSGQRLGF